jgi:hypothetical protein
VAVRHPLAILQRHIDEPRHAGPAEHFSPPSYTRSQGPNSGRST